MPAPPTPAPLCPHARPGTALPRHVLLLVAMYHQFQLFKILFKLFGGSKQYQKFPGSYADIPGFSIQFWSIQLAAARV